MPLVLYLQKDFSHDPRASSHEFFFLCLRKYESAVLYGSARLGRYWESYEVCLRLRRRKPSHCPACWLKEKWEARVAQLSKPRATHGLGAGSSWGVGGSPLRPLRGFFRYPRPTEPPRQLAKATRPGERSRFRSRNRQAVTHAAAALLTGPPHTWSIRRVAGSGPRWVLWHLISA